MTNEAVPPVPACWHQAPRWCAGQAPLLPWDVWGWVPAPRPIGLPGIPHPIGAFPLLGTFAISAAVPGLGTLRVANARRFLACHIFGVSLELAKASQGPGMGLTKSLRVVQRQLVPGGMPALGLCPCPRSVCRCWGRAGAFPELPPGRCFGRCFQGCFGSGEVGRQGQIPPRREPAWPLHGP